MVRRKAELKDQPFVLAAPTRGRMVVTAASKAAVARGITVGMVVADCRAILPELEVIEDIPGLPEKLLTAQAEWCIRYTPIAAIDLPDGLILDATGCAHLWGGEQPYLKDLFSKLKGYGYTVQVGMADTIGAAWATARYGSYPIIASKEQREAILPLPPVALRLEPAIVQKLEKLGLYLVRSFIDMPRRALFRRFGNTLLQRLDQALGFQYEAIEPVRPIEPYQERLPCLEPIRTAPGIEIALTTLLDMLCKRLEQESKGLRRCIFKGFRLDGKTVQIEIGTSRPSRNTAHLFRLFRDKIQEIEPALGIELFMLDAPLVEDLTAAQEALWSLTNNHDDAMLAELLDKIAGKVGAGAIHRYLPQEHYWPERSIKPAASLEEQATTPWPKDLPRPMQLLPCPEPIEVMVQIPDYPPALFHYRKQVHRIKKADGPERIKEEWWLEQGEYRDYYCVEDEQGARYWLFRLGSYQTEEPKWFLHGFFA